MFKLLANYIISINLIGIILMFLDKKKAVQNKFRIGVPVLLIVNILCIIMIIK